MTLVPRLTSEPGHQWLPIIKSRPRRLSCRRVTRARGRCGKVGERSVGKVAFVAAVLVVVIHHVLFLSQLHVHVCLLVVTLPVLDPMQPREPVLMIRRVRVCAKNKLVYEGMLEGRNHASTHTTAATQNYTREKEGGRVGYIDQAACIYRLRGVQHERAGGELTKGDSPRVRLSLC